MTKPKFIFSTAAFLFVCLSMLTNSFGQTPDKPQSEASFEVILQILTASNSPAADKSAVVPQSLSSVVQKMKTNYSFSNYRLSLTYLQRIADLGNIEVKNISSDPNQDVYAPVFSEFTFGQLQSLPDDKGRNSISIQSFRFGQRVPIKTASFTNESGKPVNSSVNYEQIGLFMRKLNLPENTPTVVGTLSTSKPDELMFIVLTVKPIEE